MTEIDALDWNGFTVASTFSGCGGSCLGYRMAGFRVAWANEFVDAARASYDANKATGAILDGRSIRDVKAEEILAALGMKQGELDLFDGSPPCQSFSTAGKRDKGWGAIKKYAGGTDQRNDDLFFEYARLVAGIMPKTFVAENVSGLVRGVAVGYFNDVLALLKSIGYHVKAKLLDAQWLGVPQQRQRIIFVGVREDLGFEPPHPRPLPYRYSVADACPWIMKVASNSGGEKTMILSSNPSPTVKAHTRPNTPMFGGADFIEASEPPPGAFDGVDISRFAIGKEWDNLKPGEQSGRFFSMIKTSPDAPSPTILASHGSGSIASPVHPTEKRKFSIPELRRICGFPDDFALIGTYAQQWERLGNSVPPVMMNHVARSIRDEVLIPLRERQRK